MRKTSNHICHATSPFLETSQEERGIMIEMIEIVDGRREEAGERMMRGGKGGGIIVQLV